MHDITCHAAVAFKSAAVKLSATLCAERMLSPVQQLIDAWQHMPCCSCIHEPVLAFLDRPSRLAALGWRHGHASMAALCGRLAMSAQAFLGPALGWLLSAGVIAMPLWPQDAGQES